MMDNSTSTIRLNFTLLFSVIIHLVILLGVGFTVSSPPNNPPLTSLDITLVKQQTELAPDKADFLAQANNEGGGNDAPKKAPNPSPIQKDMAPEPVQQNHQPTPPPQRKVTPPPPKPVTKTTQVITQKKAERKVTKAPQVDNSVKPVTEPTPEPQPQLKASDLILQAKSDIRYQLQQQLEQSTQALNNAPKKRRLSSRTKQYAAAAYHEAWRKKVERIGNMNYPHEAKQQRLNGSLVLSVDINPDGSVPVDGIVVSRSSGHKILDDAAIKIVRLGAPYAPVPKDVLQDYDVITIIRTWKFETDFGLK